MNYIGDYFAIGLVIVLCMFYFDKTYFLTTSSKYFIAALVLTAATAFTDIITGIFLAQSGIPLWLNMAANSIYFIINIITTSVIALFLFTKILEHAYDDHCMTYAKRGLLVLFIIYISLVVCNLKTGWMFYFDETGSYQRGPFNAAGYLITILQMGLVMVCFVRNRRNASKSMRRALIQTFPVVVMCIIVQRIYPEIMLNAFIMSMMDTVLFLTFQGQRQGIHTLTKLNDRRRFFRDTEGRLHQGETLQIFMINLQNYGAVNQMYGHLHGDEILYQFAFSLERLIKKSMAFHMNGTVFALTLPYEDQHTAEEHRRILLDFLEDGILFRKENIFIPYTVSEYIADQTSGTPSAFYEALEYSVSRAYSQSQRYIRCTGEIMSEMNRRRYLIERLQEIDRDHGFQVWYQPIRCLHANEFCSMEALLRLQEPDDTLISPAEFIPLAEQTGAIHSITWFVLEEVCSFLAGHPETGPVSVSVNLPMAQLLDRSFHTRLNSIVDRYHIDHHRICLEFTERAILDNFVKTKTTMEKLTQDGYRFYLDDFGTGYSNFNCLLQLPFQFIKLDASLIRHDNGSQDDYHLIHTLTSLFHDMNLKVIAEGAETVFQEENLKLQGVDRIQGYVYARPMSAEQLLTFYRQNPLSQQ